MLKPVNFSKNLITKKIEHWINEDIFHLKGYLKNIYNNQKSFNFLIKIFLLKSKLKFFNIFPIK
jgi:hypothetical protein